MFDIGARLLSSIASFLFPIYASYKALKTSDPAQLSPWLMYWVVLSVSLFFEAWTDWILTWVPFYGYARLLFHLYLILPQTQGAAHLYQTYIHPWISDNETQIDEFIISAHERLRAAGMAYLKRAIEYLRVNVLGQAPDPNFGRESVPDRQPATPQSYATALFNRFALPAARWPNANTDFYSLLAGAVSAATGSDRPSAVPTTSTSNLPFPNLSASGSLIPQHLRTAHPDEKLGFLMAQRERLTILLSALDRETASLQIPGAFGDSLVRTPGSEGSASTGRPSSGLSKSRSENDFEKIDAESGAEEDSGARRRGANRQSSNSGWMPWGGKSTGYDDE